MLVELEPPGGPTSTLRVRLEVGDGVSHWFDWAQVAADDIDGLALGSGFEVVERWHAGGRWFARLDADPNPSAARGGDREEAR